MPHTLVGKEVHDALRSKFSVDIADSLVCEELATYLAYLDVSKLGNAQKSLLLIGLGLQIAENKRLAYMFGDATPSATPNTTISSPSARFRRLLSSPLASLASLYRALTS